MGQWTPCPRGLGEQKLTLLSLHQPFPQPHNPPAASRPPNAGRHPTDSISMNSNGLPIFLNVYSAATLLSSLALPFTSCVTTGQSLTSLSLPFSQTNNKIILLISQGSNLASRTSEKTCDRRPRLCDSHLVVSNSFQPHEL